MPKEVWKSFDENALTHSAAHYLMTVHELLQAQGYARVTDIAKRLNITRGSCSISLKPLKKRGLVVEDDNKMLALSKEGKRLAELVEKNDELLEILFRDILGVGDEQAEIDACKIEHLLSLESSMKLAQFVECMTSGSKASKAVLQELGKQPAGCTSDSETCPLCQSVCFLEDKTQKKKAKQAASR